jgi:hypothetical protein
MQPDRPGVDAQGISVKMTAVAEGSNGRAWSWRPAACRSSEGHDVSILGGAGDRHDHADHGVSIRHLDVTVAGGLGPRLACRKPPDGDGKGQRIRRGGRDHRGGRHGASRGQGLPSESSRQRSASGVLDQRHYVCERCCRRPCGSCSKLEASPWTGRTLSPAPFIGPIHLHWAHPRGVGAEHQYHLG